MAELDKGSIFEVGTGEQWWSGKGGLLSSEVIVALLCQSLGFLPCKSGNPLVFLPGKSHGQRSVMGYSLWSCKESDMTE